MNRVQMVTQKQYRVEKLGRKPTQVHEHQNWPSWAHPGAHRHAQARARLAVSWPGLAVLWPRPPAVSQLQAAVSQHCARAPGRCAARAMPRAPALCRRRPSAVSWLPSGRVVAWQQAVSRHGCLPSHPAHCHNTPTVLRYNGLSHSSVLQYNSTCIVTSLLSPSTPSSHDTNFVS